MSGPTGTDGQYEGAADNTVRQLRSLWDSALGKNGLTADTLMSVIDAGGDSWFGGFFDTEGKASIAKNLLADSNRIDDLNSRLRHFAENGVQDDGSAYDWTKWSLAAANIGGDLSYNATLAWDASTLGPLVDAATATSSAIVTGVATGLENIGDVAIGGLKIFSSKTFLVVAIVVAVGIWGAPYFHTAAKRVKG